MDGDDLNAAVKKAKNKVARLSCWNMCYRKPTHTESRKRVKDLLQWLEKKESWHAELFRGCLASMFLTLPIWGTILILLLEFRRW